MFVVQRFLAMPLNCKADKLTLIIVSPEGPETAGTRNFIVSPMGGSESIHAGIHAQAL